MGILDEAYNEIHEQQSLPKEEPLVPFEMKVDSERQAYRMAYAINTIVRGSPFGKKLLEDVAAAGYMLQMQDMRDAMGTCNPEAKVISLNPCIDVHSLVSTLAHEARHAQQDTEAPVFQGFGKNDLVSEIMVSRAKEADAQAASAAVCYEIFQNTGNDMPYWAMHETDPMILNAFSAKRDGSGKVNDQMMQAAFEAWYKNDEIVKAYEDSYLVGPMNAAMRKKDYSNTQYNQSHSSSEVVFGFCNTPDGRCYWENDPNILYDRQKLSISSETKGVVEKFYQKREKDTGAEIDPLYKNLKVRDEDPSIADDFRTLKKVFSHDYMTNFVRDMKSAVKIEKLATPLETRRINHIVNEMCKSDVNRKNLETLAKAGYSLSMENLGLSATVRDQRNKVIVLSRQASDEKLQVALQREVRTACAQEAMKTQMVQRGR